MKLLYVSFLLNAPISAFVPLVPSSSYAQSSYCPFQCTKKSPTSVVGLSASDDSSPPSDSDGSSNSDVSFEEALKRLNKQFDSPALDQPPSSPSPQDLPGDLPGVEENASDFRIPAPPTPSFSIPEGVGVSTSSWTSSSGFVTKQLPKSKRAGTWNPGDLSVQYTSLLDGGVTFFQTDENDDYCEEMLGMFDANSRSMEVAKVGTVYNPHPLYVRSDRSRILNPSARGGGGKSIEARMGSRSVVSALQKSCGRLGVGYIELYQADLGFSKRSLLYLGGKSSVIKGLADCKKRGLCNFVGVKGVRGRKNVERVVGMFEKHGVKLDTLTAEMSVVDQGAIKDGTLDACKRAGVQFLAEEPLGVGMIGSGKYNARDPTGGEMGKPKFEFKVLEPLLGVHDGLRTVGEMVRRRLKEDWEKDRERRKGKGEKIDINEPFGVDITTSQVALKWVEAKGAIPLVSVTGSKDVAEIVAGKGWKLKGDEFEIVEDRAKEAGLN